VAGVANFCCGLRLLLLSDDYLLFSAAKFNYFDRSVGVISTGAGLLGVRETGLNALLALGVNGRDA